MNSYIRPNDRVTSMAKYSNYKLNQPLLHLDNNVVKVSEPFKIDSFST